MKDYDVKQKSGDGEYISVYFGGLKEQKAVNVVLIKGYSGGNECNVHVKDEESGRKLADLLAEVLV